MQHLLVHLQVFNPGDIQICNLIGADDTEVGKQFILAVRFGGIERRDIGDKLDAKCIEIVPYREVFCVLL
jgi:hypothetical protein